MKQRTQTRSNLRHPPALHPAEHASVALDHWNKLKGKEVTSGKKKAQKAHCKTIGASPPFGKYIFDLPSSEATHNKIIQKNNVNEEKKDERNRVFSSIGWMSINIQFYRR